MTMKIKIGVVGSRVYTDRKKVKDLIFEIKTKYGDEYLAFFYLNLNRIIMMKEPSFFCPNRTHCTVYIL